MELEIVEEVGKKMMARVWKKGLGPYFDDGLTWYCTVSMGMDYTTTQFRWFVKDRSWDEMEKNEELE
jgi:hypothetical protein